MTMTDSRPTTDAPTIVPEDQYQWWRDAVEAADKGFLAAYMDEHHPVNEHPCAGFYRDRDAAVAIWFKDGALRCKVENRLVDEFEAKRRWVGCCQKPVSHEAYEERIFEGNWPGETETVTYLSNNPPADDSLEAILASIELAERDGKRVLDRGPAMTKREADEAGNIATILAKLHAKAEAARVAEKQPWKEGAEAVDNKWRPVKERASIYEKIKAAVLTPFVKLQQEAQDKAAARAREAVEKAQREAAEKARIAQQAVEAARVTGDTKAAARAEEAAEAARSTVVNAEATALTIEAAPNTVGSIGGRKISGRRVDVFTIVDRAKVLEFFLAQPATAAEIDEVLLGMVKRAGKAKISVPGVNVSRDTVAA